jgi:drug/metabolite transporter (DMT)-like permease
MKRWLATVGLIGVTAVWGWTFVLVRDAVSAWGVMDFLAVRFAIAAAVMLPVWGRRLTPATLKTGLWIGAILAAGYTLQTWGLTLTTATNAGLITGLFVVLAPVADRLIYGTRISRLAMAAVGLSLVGMVLLTGQTPTTVALGDLLVLACAVAFGVHIAVLSRHSPEHEPAVLATAQMTALAVIFLLLWPVAGHPAMPPREVWFALVLTGVVASAMAYSIQTFAQQHLCTARTAVILTLEPVFAGFFGFVLAGERLEPLQWVGAALILGALTLSEIYPAITRSPAVNGEG